MGSQREVRRDEVCEIPGTMVKKMTIYFMCVYICSIGVFLYFFVCTNSIFYLSRRGLPKITEHDLERSSSVQSIH